MEDLIMSVAGWILMGSILTIFVVFSAVLAWGVHQTNSLNGSSETGSGNVETKAATPSKHARAA
jgi:hypothetical protein